MRASLFRLAFVTLTLWALSVSSLMAADIGKPAPSLVCQEIGGQTFDLSALRGKVVVINFWATWCPPCRQEMPWLDAIYRDLHGQGLEMIGLSMDSPHDRKAVAKAMEKLSYPAAMASQAKVNGFGLPNSIPVTYIVDADGVVRYKLTEGSKLLNEQGLRQTIQGLLPQAAKQAPAH